MTIQALLELEGATSFDFATTQADAVRVALSRRPDLITSDVKLLAGTGPAAVVEIHRRLGEVPVIFISGTPEDCQPCAPPGVVLAKPLAQGALKAAFHQVL